MIEDLVFHIGDPKTGTSSIQKVLQKRAYHCDTVTIVPQRELNASALANSLNPKRNKRGQRAQSKEELFAEKAQWAQDNTGNLGIFSAEFFANVAPQNLQQALQDYLPAYANTARVISYVRPHASRALSGYAQRVKTGSFIGTPDTFIEWLPKVSLIRYAPRFSRWEKVFGTRFTLRPFIRNELHGGDVVSDFFTEILQGVPFTLQDLPSTNESLAIEELAAMRRVQARWIKHEIPEFLRLSLGAGVSRALNTAGARYNGKLELNRGNAEALRATFLEDAMTMDRMFFERPLMQQALEQAVEKAASEPGSVEGADYYPVSRLTQLESIADEVAKLVKARPRAWRQDYQRRNGQRFDQPPSGQEGIKRRRNAEKVWGLLDELAVGLLPVSD